MNAKDQAYLLRRMLQEEEAAGQAASIEARARHEQLAAAYRARCLADPAQVREGPSQRGSGTTLAA